MKSQVKNIKLNVTCDFDDEYGQFLISNDNELTDMIHNICDHMSWDMKKTLKWMNTPNPHMGEVSPFFMIFTGRKRKLIKIVNCMIDGYFP